MADRGCRRIARHLAEAKLPAGKALDAFDFDAVPMVSKAQVMALGVAPPSNASAAPPGRRHARQSRRRPD